MSSRNAGHSEADGIAIIAGLIDEMIVALRAAAATFKVEEDRLAGSHMALLAIMNMVSTNPVVREEGLLAPLSALLAAITQTSVGGKPPLFFDVAKKAKGRPPDPRLDSMRGMIAFCVALLVDRDFMSGAAAGAFVASEARKLGLRGEGGRSVSSRAAKRFRENIMAGGSRGADLMFLQLLSGRAKHPLPEDAAAAQLEVRATLDLFVKKTGY